MVVGAGSLAWFLMAWPSLFSVPGKPLALKEACVSFACSQACGLKSQDALRECVKRKTARDVGKALESGNNFLALIAHYSFSLRKHTRKLWSLLRHSMSVEENGRVDMWA